MTAEQTLLMELQHREKRKKERGGERDGWRRKRKEGERKGRRETEEVRKEERESTCLKGTSIKN